MPQADIQFQSLLPESADSPFQCGLCFPPFRLAEVRAAEDRPAQVRADMPVLATPCVPGVHAFLSIATCSSFAMRATRIVVLRPTIAQSVAAFPKTTALTRAYLYAST
jgi:hypothetical protein